MLVKCETCKIEFNKPRCHGVRSKKHFCTRECYRNRIVEKLKNCSLCNKEIDHSKKSYSKKYCSICYKTEYYKKKPEKREKDRKRAFEKTRIRKGLPLDHPHLKAKAGEGNNTKHGYRLLWKPGHPNRKNGAGAIYEHTFVMSEHLGRPLYKGETVHHKSGDRLDNRIENLELWSVSQPAGQRVEDRIKFYKEYLEQYGYEVNKR